MNYRINECDRIIGANNYCQFGDRLILSKSELAIARVKQSLNSHVCESIKKYELYADQYCFGWVDFYSEFITRYLFSRFPDVLPYFTMQVACGYPVIRYYHHLLDKGAHKEDNILSRIWNGDLGLCDFLKLEYDSFSFRELILTLCKGMDYAFVGPFMTYLGDCVLPEAVKGLIGTVIVNMVRSTAAYRIFQPSKEMLAFIPMIFVAGIIRGVIFYYASVTFKGLGFEGRDVFYLTMIVRSVFEPQIKKLEEIRLF